MGIRYVSSIFVSMAVGVALVSFQNCAGPDGSLGDAASLKAQELNGKAPFAYEMIVNRFAYMSCVNGPKESSRQLLDIPSFFTFKVVAADNLDGKGNAGVKLTDAFKDYAFDKLIKRVNKDGELKVPRESVKKLLVESNKNSNIQIQLAVRSLDTPISSSKSSENETGVTTLLPKLTEELVADHLVALADGERLNYIDGGKGIAGRKFEGSIGFFENESTAQLIRGDIANKRKSVVTLNYTFEQAGQSSGGSSSQESVFARTPYQYHDSENQKVIYGIGFQPVFAQADTRHPDNPHHIVRDLKEFDMSVDETERTNKAGWVCDPALRYMIFSPIDAEDSSLPVRCPKIADPVATANPAIRAEMEMLRSVLPDEDWYINIPGKCITPKLGDCYPKDIPVQYETSKECGPGTTHDCAHFLSICYRTDNN